jgi:hypothetical protein
VGLAVGRGEGFLVGLPEGDTGETAGFDVGFLVGLADSLFVGGLVGLFVGKLTPGLFRLSSVRIRAASVDNKENKLEAIRAHLSTD